MKLFTRAMKALSDPGRVKVLKMLGAAGALCNCQIHPALGLAQPTVSKHLKVLEDAGFIVGEKRGQWVHYALNPSPEPLVRALLDLLAGALDQDPSVREAIRSIGPALSRLPGQDCGCEDIFDPRD
ncbi:MAG: metalloregulator ArsR/SmtB family transcription factor [Thermodesulfobacteriota bacterium]